MLASAARPVYTKFLPGITVRFPPRRATPTMPPTDAPAIAPPSAAPANSGWSSLMELNRYQWFVFVVAAVAWMADCMDQQLFNLARKTAVTDLTGGNPTNPDVTRFATTATSIFLIGWATGVLIFGMFGDRLGRVRTLTVTILLYSIFTGLSALSVGVWDFCLYRFLTGLGVGGVFSA